MRPSSPSSILHPLFSFFLLIAVTVASAQTRPANIDPTLWDKMVAINDRSAKIPDLTAHFEQKKFTPLLRKPLTSTGTIRVKGNAMVWDTTSPEPTQMRIDDREIRLYYPRQKTLEIYPVDSRLGSLAASPLPRLDVLTRYFTFAQAKPSDLGDDAPTGEDKLALKLTPSDPALREHLEQVLVLLDSLRGFILLAEMTDADGDRTRITFSDIRAGTGLTDKDLALTVPADAKISRPLEGLGAAGDATPPPPKRRRE